MASSDFWFSGNWIMPVLKSSVCWVSNNTGDLIGIFILIVLAVIMSADGE